MYVKKFLGTLLTIVILAYAESQSNFTNIKLSDRSGLYHESVGEVRFTDTELHSISYIDIRRLKAQKPHLSREMLSKVNDSCTFFSNDEKSCAAAINDGTLMEKKQLIEEYLEQLDASTSGMSLEQQYNSPWVLIKQPLFNTLTLDETNYYFNEINKYENGDNDTHSPIIQTVMHGMHDKLDYSSNQTAASLVILEKNIETSVFPLTKAMCLTMISEIGDWIRLLELQFDTYIDYLKTIINTIHWAKAGIVHPQLLTAHSVREAMRDFHLKNPHELAIFPIMDEQAQLAEILKLSKSNVAYHEGKLLLTITIPLLHPRSYELHRLYSYPTEQELGNRVGSAFVQPRAEYLLTSLGYYTFMDAEDLSKCQLLGKTYICKPLKPSHHIRGHSMCESTIVMNKKLPQPYRDCKIKISSLFKPYWMQLENGWLYSLPHPEQLTVVCFEQWMEIVNVSGHGILQLKRGCRASNADITLMGSHDLNRQLVQRKSFAMLNVTRFIDFEYCEHKLSREYTSLEVLKERVKECRFYDEKEYKQNFSIFALTLGQIFFLILIVLFYCILPAIIHRVNVKLLVIRETPV